MRTTCCRNRPSALLILLALSSPAAAWTPYGDPPPTASDAPVPLGAGLPGAADAPYPAFGSPRPSPFPGPYYGMPGRFPPPAGLTGNGSTGSAELGPDAPGATPPLPDSSPIDAPDSGGDLRFSRQVTDDAYILDIDLDGLDPTQVQVDAVGRALIIRSGRSMETRREETFDDGRAYARSFSWSSGSRVRRLPVPPDADLSRLAREDADGRIRILMPRIDPAAARGAADGQ